MGNPIIHTFRPYNPRLQGFYFYFLCLDHRHKQKHTASSRSSQVFLLNKSMKNSIHKQKQTAKLLDHHAPHHRSVGYVAILQHLFFLFIYRLQAQAHSGPAGPPRGSRLNLFFFYLYIDYKHRRDRSAKRGPSEIFLYIL